MPTYATTQDFIDTFGQAEMIDLTNLHAPGADEIDIPNLQRNQEKARALIDGMIAACPQVQAAMPFTTVPPVLKALELDVVRYYLDSLSPRDDVRARFNDALRQLNLIGQCQMSLGLPNEPAPQGSPAFVRPAPVFNRNTLADY